MEPIMKFKDIKQAEEYLQYWRSKLFLFDWIIKIKLCNKEEMTDEDAAGESDMEYINKVATISIQKNLPTKAIVHNCHEHILIHELLHLKFYSMDIITPDNTSVEMQTYNIVQHQLLEELSKSLLMAKYNLDFEWFKNI